MILIEINIGCENLILIEEDIASKDTSKEKLGQVKKILEELNAGIAKLKITV